MSDRPLVALIHNVQTPYRVHYHHRIARELAGIRIASLFTHDQPDQPWETADFAEISTVRFGTGHRVADFGRLSWLPHDWRKAGRIIRWLKDHRAAAVVIGGYNDITRLRLIAWCRRAGVPCFVFGDSNIHGDRSTGVRRIVKDRLVRWVVRRATGVMPCGTLGGRFFARYGADPARTFFTPYEPDYDLIERLPAPLIAAEASRVGLDSGEGGRRRLVVCARLISVKRVDLAIDAFAAIASERPEWDLLIIGDGPLRPALEARVPEALRARVRWTGFIGDQSRVGALYRCCHVLICPSDHEPWGVVINEAAASGLAIVSSDVVGAAAELVRDGVNGRVFPAGDLAALVGALREVTDPARTTPMRNASGGVLADWRSRGDPVMGLRRALAFAGIRV